MPGLDARAGQPGDAASVVDPRLAVLVGEMWRHCKALAALGRSGSAVLDASGVDADAAGVVTADGANAPADLLADVAEQLTLHRVWDRFPAASAS